MRKWMMALCVVFVVILVVILIPVVLYPIQRKQGSADSRELFYRRQCQKQELRFVDAVVDYAKDHGGRLPGKKGETTSEELWIESLRPYYSKQGFDIDRELCCSGDKTARPIRRFKINTKFSGFRVEDLKGHESEMILAESTPYHSPTVLTVDSHF